MLATTPGSGGGGRRDDPTPPCVCVCRVVRSWPTNMIKNFFTSVSIFTSAGRVVCVGDRVVFGVITIIISAGDDDDDALCSVNCLWGAAWWSFEELGFKGKDLPLEHVCAAVCVEGGGDGEFVKGGEVVKRKSYKYLIYVSAFVCVRV